MAAGNRRTATTPKTDENVEVENLDVPTSEIVSDDVVVNEEVPNDVVENNDAVVEEEKPRIPDVLSENPILAEFCKQMLQIIDEISTYNKDILAERDAEWNPTKLIAKARELGHPEDANVKANDEIAKAIDVWEELITQAATAKKKVLELTAKELGVTLTTTVERNAEAEAPLRDKRKIAIEIGKQLSGLAEMTQNKAASEGVTSFLAANPVPAIGRDQVRSFGDSGKSTPKYRVHVEVTRNGEVVISEDGFTKTGLALPKFSERGKALKAEDLRKAWESAGNTPENTVTDPVQFTHENLTFTITKKK